MTDSTLPSANFRPTRKLPKAFSRPVIDLGGGPGAKKREWRWVTALDIQPGDIIADLGIVHEDPPIEYVQYRDFTGGADTIKIDVKMSVGEHGPLTFDSTVMLKAFTT